AVVGASGVIATSTDGINWSSLTSPVTSDLYAVTGYAANQNNPSNPALRWVAVGDGGVSLYSVDGLNWFTGRGQAVLPDPPNPALRSLTQVAGTFFAAGDAGTILSSTDGITWTARTSGTTNNLKGITRGSIFVAVGDGGKILTSIDGNIWTTRSSGTTNILRQVSSVGVIYVAVGDAGTVVTSIDGGATWTSLPTSTTTIAASSNLVSVAAESNFVINAVADPLLGFISSAQFVAVDSTGKAYTSTNGLTWSVPITTGISTLSNVGQPLVSSGFGYAAVGASGVPAASGVMATSF
ncbi:MAG: hypothetical protein OEV26_04210, partial [Gallionella sp.]|nr:hypothetical protein [Gallionella sp.]